jgi:anaerobic magnesium-protoporphyrin IX monomethyl ester cyclase
MNETLKKEIILLYPGRGGYENILIRFLKFFLRKGKIRSGYPLNILMVGTALEKAGFIPKLINGNHEDTPRKISQLINDETLFVGISSITGAQIDYGLRAAKQIKQLYPNIPLVWGGVHVTLLPEESLATSEFVDIVVMGEGEVTAVELARTLQLGGSLKDVLGIAYKDKEGIVNRNNDRPWLNMDELPLIDFGLADPSIYNFRVINYQTSRGCPHNCTFCEVGPIHKKSYRKRSVEKVISDIEFYIHNYSTKELVIIDENFFVDLKRARRFAETIIEKNIKIKWRGDCRADYFRQTDVEFWKLMKQSGCRNIFIGIESASQRILDRVQKGYRISDITNALSQLNGAKLPVFFSFMLGFPGEEREDIQKNVEMLDYIFKCFNDVYLTGMVLLTPLPATPLFDEIKSKGVVFPKKLSEWAKYLFFNESKYIRWHPYYKEITILVMTAKWISRPTIKEYLIGVKCFSIAHVFLIPLGLIAHYRWKYKFFKFPVDIYLQIFINRFILRKAFIRY